MLGKLNSLAIAVSCVDICAIVAVNKVHTSYHWLNPPKDTGALEYPASSDASDPTTTYGRGVRALERKKAEAPRPITISILDERSVPEIHEGQSERMPARKSFSAGAEGVAL